MSGAAAVLYGLGAMVLFGLRSWQHWRATGRSGFNGFAVGRGPAARVAGMCFATAVLAGLISPVLAARDMLPMLTAGLATADLASVVAWFGTLLALTGFGLAVVAQRAMGRSWRIGVDSTERTELITRSVFAAVRNPIFTAMIIAQTGTTLMAPTWLALLGLALLIFGIELQVRRVEEPYLLEIHGNTYADYVSRTGRFLPGLGRRTKARHAQILSTPPLR